MSKHTPGAIAAATKAYWYASKLKDFESHADHKIGVIAAIFDEETAAVCGRPMTAELGHQTLGAELREQVEKT